MTAVTELREGAIVRLGIHHYRVAEANLGSRLRRLLDGDRTPVRLTLETLDSTRAVKERELPRQASVQVVAP